MIVVDANVLVYMLVPGPRTSDARATFRRDPVWRAPRLWRSEFRQFLLGRMRRGETVPSDAAGLIAAAAGLLGA